MTGNDSIHGYIHVSCEVACYNCGWWMLGLKHPKADAERELRSIGWRQLRGHWTCPSCVDELRKAGMQD